MTFQDVPDGLVAHLMSEIGKGANDPVDKTGVMVGGSTYLADTAAGSQSFAPAPGAGETVRRCDFAEAGETNAGGNGALGHDATPKPESR